MLMYQHANADAIQVETVEKILNEILDVCRDLHMITFHLEDSLRHGLDHRRMPITNGI